MTHSLSSLGPELFQAVQQTLWMLLIGLTSSAIFGGLVGTLLFLWNEESLLNRKSLYFFVGAIVNTVRSFPFVILMIAFNPLAKVITGTTIGPIAASIPLSVAGIAYFARLVELALNEVPKGVIEATVSMGASLRDIVFRVLWVEARAPLVLGFTALTISYLSYTAAAGIIGGGGIGDLAVRYGYYRFQTEVMVVTVIGLVALVQIIQFVGTRTAKNLDKRR